MPIENEFKYVLDDPDGGLRRSLADHPDVVIQRIDQAYLAKGVRVRRIEDLETGDIAWMLTFKRRVDKRVIEIETPISSDDFEALWPTCEAYLTKTRYKIPGEDGIKWDIDFFGKKKKVYFVMAEAEMPPHLELSEEVPEPCPEIAGHLVYVVGKERGFSSRRLCDRRHAVRLMTEIRELAESERPAMRRAA